MYVPCQPQSQPQPAHSSLSTQYHQQHQQNLHKKRKLDHVLQQQHQAVDLCGLSLVSVPQQQQQQQHPGQPESVSLYEVSSTTGGCGSSSGPSRSSHGVAVSNNRIHTSAGHALVSEEFSCLSECSKFTQIFNFRWEGV
jgi:hypothetical protein